MLSQKESPLLDVLTEVRVGLLCYQDEREMQLEPRREVRPREVDLWVIYTNMTVPSKPHEQCEGRNEEEGEQRGPPDAPGEVLHSRAADRGQLDMGTPGHRTESFILFISGKNA